MFWLPSIIFICEGGKFTGRRRQAIICFFPDNFPIICEVPYFVFIFSFRSHQLLLYPRAYQETQQRYGVKNMVQFCLSTKRLLHQERSLKFHAYPISLKNWKIKQKRLCTCNKKWMSWMPLWRFEWFCDFYIWQLLPFFEKKKVCGLINIPVSLSIGPVLGLQSQSIFPSLRSLMQCLNHSQHFCRSIQLNLCFLKHVQSNLFPLRYYRSPTYSPTLQAQVSFCLLREEEPEEITHFLWDCWTSLVGFLTVNWFICLQLR